MKSVVHRPGDTPALPSRRRRRSRIAHLAAETMASLDLPLVLEYFAQKAQTERGKHHIRHLKPRSRDHLEAHYADLDCWKTFLDRNSALRFPAIPEDDVFKRHPRLDPFDADILRDVRDCLAFWLTSLANEALEFLHTSHLDDPVLRGLLTDLSGLFDRQGDWRRDITPRLKSLYEKLDHAYDRLNSAMSSALAKMATYLSESVIFERNGRKVLAVNADFKGRVRGIVQDFSASGKTVFVEPEAAITHQNALVQHQTEIAEEIWSIRCDITERILGCSDFTETICPELARWDACQAMVRVAQETHCAPIVPNDDQTLLLKTARHPYLDSAFAEIRRVLAGGKTKDRHRMVPFDLVLDKESRGLIVSGPNTGGKTVTLKTTGLLALMANMGLPIPVEEGSAIPRYAWILADIGDTQSLAESLSSFASHLVFIREMLTIEEPNALILLDELGSGTDPQEGNALSQAIIELMMDRGFHVIVTTHHQVLCTMALNHPNMDNGSMAFDPNNLRPTYRFMMGIPGRSHALDIAAQAGLDAQVLARAQDLLDDHQVDLQGALEELQRKTKEIQKMKSKLRRDQRRLVGKIQKTKSRETRLEEIQQEIEAKSKQRIQAKVEKAERALRHMLDDVASKKTRRNLVTKFAKVKKDIVPEEEQKRTRNLPGTPSNLGIDAWSAGDTVFIESFGREATLVAVEKSKVRVDCRGMALLVDVDDVIHLKPEKTPEPVISQDVETSTGDAPTLELMLLGFRVEDALLELDTAIDRAMRQEQPFLRIVHGHGTGALKSAIRDFLKSHREKRAWKMQLDPNRDGETVLRFQ